MKIRFAVTLLAVALAVMGSKASALAPVIGFVPDVVIADDGNPATGSSGFYVYPDAINVTKLAVDVDNTVTSSTMIWSYLDAGTRYRINDQDPVASVAGAAAPTALQSLTAAGDPADADGNVRTLTFRDTTLSPVGFSNVGPAVAGSEVVTLLASDGDKFTSATFLVVTDPTSGAVDHLSSAGKKTPLLPQFNQAPGAVTGSSAWSSSSFNSTTMINGTNGLCMAVTAAGQNLGLWIGPSKIVDLVQNSVYRFRLTMNNGGVYVPDYHFPFWDMVIDNYEPTFANGSGKYFGDFMVWDVNGGAETLGNGGGRSTFDVWWAPMPLLAADWNNATSGEFTALKNPTNDVRIFLRVLDTTTGAIDGANDYGTVCLANVKIDRVDFGTLVKARNLYDQTDLSASTMAIGSIFPRQIAGSTTITNGARTLVTWSAGDLTLQPYRSGAYGDGAWDVEVINVDSGDSSLSMGTPASLPDNFPFRWDSDRLLMGSITVTAPDHQAEVNPVDALVLIFDEPTNELLQNSAIVSSANTLGFPKENVDTDLVAFLYTHARTKSTTANANRIRLRLLIINTTTLYSVGSNRNLGGIKIKRFKVDEYIAPVIE